MTFFVKLDIFVSSQPSAAALVHIVDTLNRIACTIAAAAVVVATFFLQNLLWSLLLFDPRLTLVCLLLLLQLSWSVSPLHSRLL